MRLIYVAFILLLVLMTSAQCQRTAEEWSDKGMILAGQGKYAEAIEAYDEAIKLNPNLVGVWNSETAAAHPAASRRGIQGAAA
jgi:tetratricopeptide (TPR) repeat protein